MPKYSDIENTAADHANTDNYALLHDYLSSPPIRAIQFDTHTRSALTRSQPLDHLSGNVSSHSLFSRSLSHPEVDTTEAFLRRFAGICDPHLLILENIPGPRSVGKLPGTTEIAVAIAIWSSPDKMLPLQGIYDTIENACHDLRDMPDKPWKRTVRHTLSLKGMFMAVSRTASGRGKYWALNIARSGTEKRERKRRQSRNAGALPAESIASPHSQIIDLDNDYIEPWLNDLHMQEVSKQTGLFRGSGLTNGLPLVHGFANPPNNPPIGDDDNFGPPSDNYVPFGASAFAAYVSGGVISTPSMYSIDKFAIANNTSVYPSYSSTIYMPHPSLPFRY